MCRRGEEISRAGLLFVGNTGGEKKKVDSFCLKAEAGDGLICSNSGLVGSGVYVCAARLLLDATRTLRT